MVGLAFRLGPELEVELEECEDEFEELENELAELEEAEEEAVIVREGLWTFLGLSHPNLLKPLTGRAWEAGVGRAELGLGGLPLFLLGPLGTRVEGAGAILLKAALEVLCVGFGFSSWGR